MDIYSKNITGAVYHLTKDMGIFRLSVQAQGGTVLYKGAFNISSGDSAYVPLLEGDTLVLDANPNGPIELFIDPNGNSAVLLAFYN